MWATSQISTPDVSNDELFFGLFETENQTESDMMISAGPIYQLSARLTFPLVWLHGSPGCSSFDCLIDEYGPLRFCGDFMMFWSTQLMHCIDQPLKMLIIATGDGDEATFSAQVTQKPNTWPTYFYEVFPQSDLQECLHHGQDVCSLV